MKPIVILMLALGVLLGACKNAKTDCRRTAWEYIGADQQATVNIDWRQAPVEQVEYKGKKACRVRFNTTQDELLGPISIYVEEATGTVLGQDMKD